MSLIHSSINTSQAPSRSTRSLVWLALGSLAILAIIIFFIYYSSISTGFFADDYNFLEPVARLDLAEYLRYYFDPRLQVLWYRPLQGIQILIEWKMFGTNAAGYHLVNIFFHVVNCSLLFALVWRISRKWHIAFAAAFCYATFPVYALAVNWINITDPLATIFYLTGIWLWWSYLEEGKRHNLILTLVCYAVALLIKQMAITLPVILGLIDYLFFKPSALSNTLKNIRTLPFLIRDLIQRYWAFALIGGAFAMVQYTTRSTHTFASTFGYTLGLQVVSILIQYLSLLVFPYGYFLPTDTQFTEGMPFSDERNLIWLALATLTYLFITLRTRSRTLIFLGLALLVTLAPVLPFPFIELRYLYLPSIVSGILLALLLDHAITSLKHPHWITIFAAFAFATITLGSSLSIANANAGIFEFARQRRVPFRDISRAHPTFPEDTRLYFIDSISPLSELTGMFTLRYGRSVTVAGNDSGRDPMARLREHKSAWVYYFDETGKPIQVPVEPEIAVQPSQAMPVVFTAPIQLDGYELPQTTIRRGDALVVILYWRAIGKIDQDLTAFIHLVDKDGRLVASYDSQPHKNQTPTSQWSPTQFVVDPILLTVPPDAPPGDGYVLNIGLYEYASQQRLSIVNRDGQPAGDALTLAPFRVVEK